MMLGNMIGINDHCSPGGLVISAAILLKEKGPNIPKRLPQNGFKRRGHSERSMNAPLPGQSEVD